MSLDNSRQLMALAVGARLGHYTVTAKIGQGGMGEVYQARDTTLDRDVALKVLPEAFTVDPDRPALASRIEAELSRGGADARRVTIV